MPPKPTWLRKIPQIRAALERATTPFLDRAAIEKLFGLRRSEAAKLLRRFGGSPLGNSLAVDRLQLLARLKDRDVGSGAAAELVRRRHVRDVIEEARRDLATRTVRIQVPPGPVGTVQHLPPTIRLAPGELRVSFAGAQDLLQQLFLLSQAIGRDFQAFEAAIQGSSRIVSADPEEIGYPRYRSISSRKIAE